MRVRRRFLRFVVVGCVGAAVLASAVAGAQFQAVAGAAAAGSAGLAAGGGGSAISADGRFVAFTSGASNLVATDSAARDTNAQDDVFVRDRLRGRTERVSVSSGGEEGNGRSGTAAINADGRFIAFQSEASNLVRGDTNRADDVFVRDRATGKTTRVSLGRGGRQAKGLSAAVAISGDGRFVVFTSSASNLAAGDTNRTRDVFVRDRRAGTTQRVSVGSSGRQWRRESESFGQAISAHGRLVAFTRWGVFVRDRVRRKTEPVSVSSGGEVANGESFENAISADGRFVTFRSDARNLAAADTADCVYPWRIYNCDDVFVRDRLRHKTELVSVSRNGQGGNGDSGGATISANGRFVAFQSRASNLVAHDTYGQCGGVRGCLQDVFVRDRLRRTTERVSVSSVGKQANRHSEFAAISANGRVVAFQSDASNLAGRDTNRSTDVFVRDRLKKTTELVSIAAPSAAGDEAIGSFWKESYAERQVLAKVKIPCKKVHPVTRKDKTCDRKFQLKAFKPLKAELAQAERTLRTAKEGSSEQVDAMRVIDEFNDSNFGPDFYLALIRYGYRLSTARCTGTGRADRSGHRFSQFRCDVRIGMEMSTRLAIRVKVTAPKTFRWTII